MRPALFFAYDRGADERAVSFFAYDRSPLSGEISKLDWRGPTETDFAWISHRYRTDFPPIAEPAKRPDLKFVVSRRKTPRIEAARCEKEARHEQPVRYVRHFVPPMSALSYFLRTILAPMSVR